ncbi:MAG: hypothetical protein ACHQFZ_00870 [Acidimicrobiales bacterium]
MLDIGGDTGALLLRVPPEWNGREIDLRPQDPGVAPTHSEVRERRLLGGVAYAAVYPSLASGRYTLAGSLQPVTVTGGSVTEIELDVASFDRPARTSTVRAEPAH